MIRGAILLMVSTLLATPAIAAPPPQITADYQTLKTTASHLPAAYAADTTEALSDRPCIRHRTHLDNTTKHEILAELTKAGFLSPAHDDTERARQLNGLFPSVRAEDSGCPLPLQAFIEAPGGNAGSHHAWPGGLVQHERFNLASSMALSDLYDRQSGVPVDREVIATAVLWHDWAKMLVFPWQPDGSLPAELSVAGTGAHHILGLAETMKRGLPVRLTIVQACAHTAPIGDDAIKVANWLRAAAIVARIDPVKAGYLTADGRIDWHGIGPWRECLIETASDDNWQHAEMVVNAADEVLVRLAPRFGYDPTDGARYRTHFRNVVMAWIGPDRLYALGSTEGDDTIVVALTQLRRQGLI